MSNAPPRSVKWETLIGAGLLVGGILGYGLLKFVSPGLEAVGALLASAIGAFLLGDAYKQACRH